MTKIEVNLTQGELVRLKISLKEELGALWVAVQEEKEVGYRDPYMKEQFKEAKSLYRKIFGESWSPKDDN